MTAGGGLTGRYCILQGSYYGVNCAVIGYASVFLLERGMSPAGIGALIAAGNVMSAVCQPLTAGIADRSKRISLKQIIRLTAAAGAGLSLLVGVSKNLTVLVPLYMLLALIANLEMPLVNAVSVYYSNRGGSINFGLARGIGSLTYAAFSYGLGLLAGMFGSGLVPWASMALYSAVFISCGLFEIEAQPMGDTVKCTEDAENLGAAEASAVSSAGFFLRYRAFTLTLAGVVLLFSFHNITCTYMIRMVERFGGGSADMGLALAVAAVCEIPTMLLFSRISRRFGVPALLAVSGLCFFIKSLMLLAAWNVTVLLAAQMFQAFSFALFIPASVAYTDLEMDAGDKIKGQAYMTAASTLGSVAGNLSGGIVLDAYGVSAMLTLASAFALTGCLTVAAATLKRTRT